MDITSIPFVALIGIKKKDQHSLSLEYAGKMKNHIGTLHAGALFTLAETQSALALMQRFDTLDVSNVLPLLRSSKIIYRQPAESDVSTVCMIDEDQAVRFEERYQKRGNGMIEVNVDVIDRIGSVCAKAEFVWFVSKSR